MRDEEVQRLRRAFGEPRRWITDHYGVPEARAQALLRDHVMDRLDDALAAAHLTALVVKGEALARTVYPEPWMRPMGDIDLLVPARDWAQAFAALTTHGFTREPPPEGRPLSNAWLGEAVFSLQIGAGRFLVELHTGLDKIVDRNIDLDAILGRASPAGKALALPALEDHLLLVALHAATTDFDHALAWLDLHLLFSAGPEVDVLVRRARAWDLTIALYVVAQLLGAAGSPSVPEEVIERCRPARWRQRWFGWFFPLDAFPPRGRRPPGLPWLLRQASLRDDTARWFAGCARYALGRAVERAAAAASSSAETASRTDSAASRRRG